MFYIVPGGTGEGTPTVNYPLRCRPRQDRLAKKSASTAPQGEGAWRNKHCNGDGERRGFGLAWFGLVWLEIIISN